MRRPGCWSIILFLLILPRAAAAQEGGGHTLYGDLKVDSESRSKLAPQTLQVILYNSAGTVISRQAVPANGRYQFMNVFNGLYELAVEIDNQEVARIPITLRMMKKTDIRRDVNLRWGGEGRAVEVPVPAVVPVSDLYARTPEAGRLLKEAVEARDRGDAARAVRLLSRIVKDDPDDFQALVELGITRHNQGELKEAEKAYGKAIDKNPGYAPALLNLGKLRIVERNHEDAVRLLSRAVESDPARAEAHFFLGEAYLQAKKGSLAVGELNEALRLDPVGMADAHLRLGALYNAAGLKDRAAAEYEKFLEKKPDYPDREKLLQYIRENKRP